ncbi:MAG: hypothetical protein AAGI90_02850 [Chlamydiota bacterium]
MPEIPAQSNHYCLLAIFSSSISEQTGEIPHEHFMKTAKIVENIALPILKNILS